MTTVFCKISSSFCLFVRVKPFSFIRSRQIINRYGDNVSPWKKPAIMLEKSVSPTGEQANAFVKHQILMWR